MPEEGEWHRRVRESVMLLMGEMHLRHLHDHGKDGHPLRFYRGEVVPERHFSDADVVVLNKDGEVAHIIEIMSGNPLPKAIIGITGATSLCDACVDVHGGKHAFAKPTLWIIVDSRRVEATGSSKTAQIDALQVEIRDECAPLVRRGSLADVIICSERSFEAGFRAVHQRTLHIRSA